MAGEQVQRRLAAIVSTDIVGYSRMMGSDETGTLARLKLFRRELLDPKIAAYGGRVIKTMGDGTLIEFGSAVNAVSFAVELQKALAEHNEPIDEAERLLLRVGINVGDVITDEDDIYGDGVNIAARLEPLAPPGGVCISRAVHDQVHGKTDSTLVRLGAQTLKNISEPVEVWRIDITGPVAGSTLPSSATPLPLPDKPSVAVLPFSNMSSNPDEDYFADGITEDIITDLSKASGLLVIARNSSFTYKGKNVGVETVCRELNVRYVLTGSVRRADRRVRISANLVQGAENATVWADRYDHDLEDILAVQDEVTRKIVGALRVELTPDEMARREEPSKVNPEAQDHLYRGRALLFQFKPESLLEAREMTERAIEIDPSMASAYATLALIIGTEFLNGWNGCQRETLDQGVALSRKAVELDPDSGEGYATLCILQLWRREFDAAIAAGRQCVALDPNLALGRSALGQVLDFSGHHEEAVGEFAAAFRLDPRYDLMLNAMGRAQFALGRYDQAETNFRRRLVHKPDTDVTRAYLAALLGQTDRPDEARRLWNDLLAINPDFDAKRLRSVYPYRDSMWFDRFYEGLEKAGIAV